MADGISNELLAVVAAEFSDAPPEVTSQWSNAYPSQATVLMLTLVPANTGASTGADHVAPEALALPVQPASVVRIVTVYSAASQSGLSV